MNRRRFLNSLALGAGACLLPLPGFGGPVQKPLSKMEIYHKGIWSQIPWPDLKADMVFRIRNLDGSLSCFSEEGEMNLALTDTFADPHGTYGVQCEPFTNLTNTHVEANRLVLWANGAPMTHWAYGDTFGEVQRPQGPATAREVFATVDLKHHQLTYRGSTVKFDYFTVLPRS